MNVNNRNSINSLIHVFSCFTSRLKLFLADKNIFELPMPLLHSQLQQEFPGCHINHFLHNKTSNVDIWSPLLKLKLIYVFSGSPELKFL